MLITKNFDLQSTQKHAFLENQLIFERNAYFWVTVSPKI
jgi:hypothetical protein